MNTHEAAMALENLRNHFDAFYKKNAGKQANRRMYREYRALTDILLRYVRDFERLNQQQNERFKKANPGQSSG